MFQKTSVVNLQKALEDDLILFLNCIVCSGLNSLAVAQLFVQLMARLGFDKFYAQGGDWGSVITTDLAVVFPER